MINELKEISADGWICEVCDAELQNLPVSITYLDSSFEVSLPRCPKCGFTFIPPELAEGKMLEVEKILEDK